MELFPVRVILAVAPIIAAVPGLSMSLLDLSLSLPSPTSPWRLVEAVDMTMLKCLTMLFL